MDNIDKGKENTIVPNATVPGGNYIIGFGEIIISNEEEADSIMLGETKYFGVEKKTADGTLKIVEIKTDYGKAPKFPTADDGWTWVNQDVWGANPVVPYIDKGDISIVYWEKKYPLFNSNGFAGMHNFSEKDKNNKDLNGMIRVIGRYWKENTDNETPEVYNNKYSVKLTATLDNKTTNLTLRVVKPSKLLTDDNSTSYKMAKAINGEDLDIDNYLIKNGGENGIPPQLMKGQIFSESWHKKSEHFWPSYRYEPWQDLYFRNQPSKSNAEYYKKQPYWITDNTNMGAVNGGEPVPTGHQNVRPELLFSTSTPYPNSPMKIGDYVANNIGEYYNDDKNDPINRIFNSKKLQGPNDLQNVWDILLRYFRIIFILGQDGNHNVENNSDYYIKQYIRIRYDEYAQTRKAASYGYFQMLYTTAICVKDQGPGYPRRPGNYPAPEKMADHDIFMPYIIKYLKLLVKFNLKSSENFDSNNWSSGFEGVWLKSYHKYNGRSGYDKEVVTNSKIFLPK